MNSARILLFALLIGVAVCAKNYTRTEYKHPFPCMAVWDTALTGPCKDQIDAEYGPAPYEGDDFCKVQIELFQCIATYMCKECSPAEGEHYDGLLRHSTKARLAANCSHLKPSVNLDEYFCFAQNITNPRYRIVRRSAPMDPNYFATGVLVGVILFAFAIYLCSLIIKSRKKKRNNKPLDDDTVGLIEMKDLPNKLPLVLNWSVV